MMHALLEHGGILGPAMAGLGGGDGYLERMACLVAAAAHDYEHPGVSNDFLVRTRDDRALLYNDQSVNETHHVSAAFRLLSRRDCNFLTGLPAEQFRRLRSLVISLVLATDAASGSEI